MSAGGVEGSSHATRGGYDGKYIGDGNPGPTGGGTYTSEGLEPTMQDYENVFGPAARDIKFDTQRSKRHQRWHLPDALKGANPWLTDRIDGLITDADSSPFTSYILPYKYIDQPDGKMKWNVWSFDEGMASRVPYESAARVLTQTKKSYAGYTVRQGLAIVMEHNFMKSAKGMENFRNQLRQMVGSIQYTNDLDVHMALIQAPSHAKVVAEKYFSTNKTSQQLVREYVDLFGICQKNPNALDLLIEEAKSTLRNWGSPEPSFLLTNPKLTVQLQMSPERTNYVTQGYDGVKRLRTGPNIDSYRGLNIIKSRSFSMDAGVQPRDVLCRRVRVAEYYHIKPNKSYRSYQLYDQSKDTWFELTPQRLYELSSLPGELGNQGFGAGANNARNWGSGRSGARGNGGGGGGGVSGGVGANASADAPTSAVGELTGDSNLLYSQECAGLLGKAAPGMGTDVTVVKVNTSTWDSYPYNSKVSLMPSVGPLFIGEEMNSKAGAHPLVCDTVYWDNTEKQFAMTLTQGTNLVLQQKDNTGPYVRASAWIGGGIFCDTTYHFSEQNSLAQPQCSWSALDVANPRDYTATNMEIFKPGEPNMFNFTFKNAHDPSNLAPPPQIMKDLEVQWQRTATENTLAALLGHVFVSKTLLAGLLTPMFSKDERSGRDFDSHANDVVDHYYNFLTPHTAGELPSAETIKNGIFSDQDTFQSIAWQSRLMTLFMACLHPSAAVRKRAASNLNQGTVEMIGNFVKLFATRVQSKNIKAGFKANELAAGFFGDIERTFKEGSSDISEFKPFSVDARSDHGSNQVAFNFNDCDFEVMPNIAAAKIFAAVMAKHMFCASRRFHNGGDNNLGLSLLTRQWAYVGAEGSDETSASAIQAFGTDIAGPVFGTRSKASQNGIEYTSFVRCRPSHIAGKALFGLSAKDCHALLSSPLDKGDEGVKNELLRLAAKKAGGNVDAGGLKAGMSSKKGLGYDYPVAYAVGDGDDDEMRDHAYDGTGITFDEACRWEYVIFRPNIEHEMLGVIMGRGGVDELGATLWGQTELSCYDDAQHGVWGMSYKYHERAQVFNEKNMIRLWDIAFDTYNGGMDDTEVAWTDQAKLDALYKATYDMSRPYSGPSLFVMRFPAGANSKHNWPSPIVFHDNGNAESSHFTADPECIHQVMDPSMRILSQGAYADRYNRYKRLMPDYDKLARNRKPAGMCSSADETAALCKLAFQGTMRGLTRTGNIVELQTGCGHLGPSYVGVASVRDGKGYKTTGPATYHKLV